MALTLVRTKTNNVKKSNFRFNLNDMVFLFVVVVVVGDLVGWFAGRLW